VPRCGTNSRSSVVDHSGGFGRLDADAVAEGFDLSGETPRVRVATTLLEPVRAEVRIGDALVEDVEGGDEHRVLDSLSCLRVANPSPETLELPETPTNRRSSSQECVPSGTESSLIVTRPPPRLRSGTKRGTSRSLLLATADRRIRRLFLGHINARCPRRGHSGTIVTIAH